jgi:hypothetical protein
MGSVSLATTFQRLHYERRLRHGIVRCFDPALRPFERGNGYYFGYFVTNIERRALGDALGGAIRDLSRTTICTGLIGHHEGRAYGEMSRLIDGDPKATYGVHRGNDADRLFCPRPAYPCLLCSCWRCNRGYGH